MELIKVLIVDDEILAIEDINNLINWEENGFKIVSTTTSSKQAIELFKTHQPDVVFLDIKMPVINGLDLSDKFLKLDDSIKIVLLTAYKDFQYAKRAVELGVSNYLVKHEINKDSLKFQLKKIKNELLDQYNMNKIIKNQFLINILKNEDVDQWPLESTVDFYCNSNNEYGLILIKQDRPYLLDYFRDEEIKLSQTIEIDSLVWPKHISSIDLLDFNNELVILLSFKNIKSWQEKKKLLYQVARNILNLLNNEYSATTFSTIISNTYYDIQEMSGVFNSIDSILSNKVFFKKSKSLFIYQNDYTAYKENDKNLDVKALLDNLLRKEGTNKLKKELENAFDIISTYTDHKKLDKFIAGLLKYIEEKRKKYGMPSLQDLYKNSDLNLNQYTLDEVKRWFSSNFTQLQSLRDPNFYNYSTKVQQAILFIHENYNLQIARKDLAEHIGISQVYISQLFKKETKKTFLDYLTQYRIKMARYLLLNSDKKVYEVADSVGYASSQYFSQVFYKETGRSPLEYREEGVLSD